MFRGLRGFTFIELLLTLLVMAVCFLPLMRMFSVSLEQAYINTDLTTARFLAQAQMEKVKNLGFTEAQIEALGDIWEPDMDEPAMELNGNKWRVRRKIIQGTDPLEVRVQVYQEQNSRRKIKTESFKPVIELVTLIEDLDWTPLE